jgi:alpha-amylase
MKKPNFKFYLLSVLLVWVLFVGLNEEIITTDSAASQFKVINVTHHDGHPFSTGTTTSTTGKYMVRIPEEGL